MTPEISHKFMEVVKEHTAGSPQHDILWTNLRQPEIASRLNAAGLKVVGYPRNYGKLHFSH